MKKKRVLPALRVSQLDTTELDDNVIQLLAAQLQSCFKYRIGSYDFMQYEPHLRAAMHGVLLYFTLWRNKQTIGQKLLGLRYGEKSKFGEAPRRRLIFLQAALSLNFWLKSTRMAGRSFLSKYDTLRSIANLIESLVEVGTLFNFLLFLRQGHYHTVLLRLAGLRTVYVDENPPPREVTHELMRRELLWHGFAETGVFFLSLINLGKMRRKILQLLYPQAETDLEENWNECAFCRNTPVMPHEGACARHAYCYYCVTTVITVDEGAKCPSCNCTIEAIRPLRTQRHALTSL